MPNAQKNTPNSLNAVGGIVGAAGGWALSQYAGPSLWIPGAATALLLVLFTKTHFGPKFFRGAISVTGGHVIWFIVASAVGGLWSSVALDIAALAAGLAWLWVRPSMAPAIFLGTIQVASLVVNAVRLFSSEIGSSAHRALTVHCVFRVLAVICLVAGYRRMRTSATGASSTATVKNERISPQTQ